MKILPITPTYKPTIRQRRAAMSIRRDEHVVTDTVTGEQFALPAEEAWEKYQAINLWV